jgi:hypothetical protein
MLLEPPKRLASALNDVPAKTKEERTKHTKLFFKTIFNLFIEMKQTIN